MYFRLLPHVFLVKGEINSIIQNVLSQEILVVDSELSELIKQCENNKPFDEKYKNQINELVSLKLGKVTSRPIFVDKLRFSNAKYDLFESDFASFSEAVLQLTNDCKRQCGSCGENFCPMCVHKDDISDMLDLYEWEKVIDKLEMLNCKSFVLTGGDVTLCSYFYDVVKYIVSKSLDVTVCLNESAPEIPIDKSVKIKIFVTNFDSLDGIFQRYEDFVDVTLCCYFAREKIDVPENFHVCFCKDDVCEENISCSDLMTFHNRMHTSQCKKITVMSNGDVYPCFGAATDKANSVGNIHDVRLEKLASDLKEIFWTITVNMIKKCQDCEYRYTCDSCIFFDARKHCKYDIDKGEWIG